MARPLCVSGCTSSNTGQARGEPGSLRRAPATHRWWELKRPLLHFDGEQSAEVSAKGHTLPSRLGKKLATCPARRLRQKFFESLEPRPAGGEPLSRDSRGAPSCGEHALRTLKHDYGRERSTSTTVERSSTRSRTSSRPSGEMSKSRISKSGLRFVNCRSTPVSKSASQTFLC